MAVARSQTAQLDTNQTGDDISWPRICGAKDTSSVNEC